MSSLVAAWRSLASCVWCSLLNAMDRRQVSLENIYAIEGFLMARCTRAESTGHNAFVMREGVPVLVVFPREAFHVIFAGGDRTLLWPFLLVSKHVCFEVLEGTATFGNRALSRVCRAFLNLEASTA